MRSRRCCACTSWLGVNRGSACFEPAAGHGRTHPQRWRDRFGRQATQAQSVQCLIASLSLRLPFRPSSCLFRAIGCRRRFFLPGTLPGCDEPRGPTHGTAVAIDRSLHGITEIAQQVPAIRHLDGIGRALSGAFGRPEGCGPVLDSGIAR